MKKIDTINRNELLGYIDALYAGHYKQAYDQTIHDIFNAVRRRIRRCAALDVVEVKHGQWVWDIETYGDPMYGVDEDFGYRCSECKVWADEYGVDGDIYEEPPTHILRYCPNCGAKMFGGI